MLSLQRALESNPFSSTPKSSSQKQYFDLESHEEKETSSKRKQINNSSIRSHSSII